MTGKLLAVLSIYLFLALPWWPGRVQLLIMLVVVFGPPAHDAHLAGLARLERAGLRRHVDRDGVRLEGSARVSSPA
jgi:hypothetical protein